MQNNTNTNFDSGVVPSFDGSVLSNRAHNAYVTNNATRASEVANAPCEHESVSRETFSDNQAVSAPNRARGARKFAKASRANEKTHRTSRIWLPVAVCALLFALAFGVGGTYAAVLGATDPSNFPGSIDGKLEGGSTTTVLLGETKQDIGQVVNTGKDKLYAQIQISKQWLEKDANDQWVPVPTNTDDGDNTDGGDGGNTGGGDGDNTGGQDTNINPETSASAMSASQFNTDLIITEVSDDWIDMGEGNYRYSKALKPGETSTSLLDSVTLSMAIGDEYNDNTHHANNSLYTNHAGEITLTLSCTAEEDTDEYNVVFDSMGGSDVETQVVKKGAYATRPTPPVREGYTFQGWYSDDAWKTAFDFGATPITDDITLYAKWKEDTTPLHVVTFYPQGGTPVDSQKVEQGKCATKPTPDPTREGYVFGGWYSYPDCLDTDEFDFNSPINSATAVYAKWLPKDSETCIVDFDTHGGTTVAERVVVKGSTTYRPENDPTREGYIFSGWFADEDCIIEFNFGDAITQDTTVHAKWVTADDNTTIHTVKFDTQGGSPEADQLVKNGECATQPANNPTNGSKIFGGWYKDSACTKLFDFSSPITSATIVYAKWYDEDASVHCVKFETFGGTKIPDRYVEDGAIITRPDDPVKDGYVFAGWYADSNCTQEFNYSEGVVSDAIIYAKWVPAEEVEDITHTVTFITKGGSTVEDEVVKHEETATKPKDPTKTGYTFGGWFSDYDCTTPYDFAKGVTSATAIYAKWIPGTVKTYDVTFNTHGGTTYADLVVEENTSIRRPADPVKQNCDFAGWFLDEACTIPYNFNDPVTSNLTIHAKWIDYTPVIHVVKFESNGGTYIADVEVENGNALAAPSDPVREGYVFLGWFEDQACTIPYDFSQPVTNSMTLYAKWVLEDVRLYTVTFDSRGGSDVASQTVEEGAQATRPANPTRAGYSFGGWYTDERCTNEYDFDSGVYSDITLYAKWTNSLIKLSKTGDNFGFSPLTLILFALALASFVLCLFALLKVRRRNREDEALASASGYGPGSGF